jgi:hypothetical protein
MHKNGDLEGVDAEFFGVGEWTSWVMDDWDAVLVLTVTMQCGIALCRAAKGAELQRLLESSMVSKLYKLHVFLGMPKDQSHQDKCLHDM